MTKYQAGADALSALNANNDESSNTEFTSFKSGSTFNVKVLGTADLITFYSYGIFKVVNSFVAKEPSKKSAKGYPVDNLTVWDKAWKYHADKSDQFQDEHSQESYKYSPKQRFAMGFYNVDNGEQIIVDVSKNQAQVIHGSIVESADKLGRVTFKLAKKGSGTKTVVSLSPYVDTDMVDKMIAAGIDVEDNLTLEQRNHFNGSPESFDMKLFDGLLFEADEDQQIENLVQAGFDVNLIGLDKPKGDAGAKNDATKDDADSVEISDSDLPF